MPNKKAVGDMEIGETLHGIEFCEQLIPHFQALKYYKNFGIDIS